MMSIERADISVGKHRAWIEEPYVAFMDFNGDITGEDILGFLAVVESVGGGAGPVIIVQYMANSGAFTASARKTIANDPRSARIETAVAVNATFQSRILLKMIEKTNLLIGKMTVVHVFVDSKDEAMRFLASERPKLQARKGGK